MKLSQKLRMKGEGVTGSKDPYWSDVLIYLPFTENFLDKKNPDRLTIVNGTFESQLTDSCLKLNNINANNYSTHDLVNIGPGNFTIEFYINYKHPGNSVTRKIIFGNTKTNNQNEGFLVGMGRNYGNPYLDIRFGSNISVASNSHSSIFLTDTFVHVVLVRNNNTFLTFINGTKVNEYINTEPNFGLLTNTTPFTMNNYNSYNGVDGMIIADIKHLRITKIARYLENFDPNNILY